MPFSLRSRAAIVVGLMAAASICLSLPSSQATASNGRDKSASGEQNRSVTPDRSRSAASKRAKPPAGSAKKPATKKPATKKPAAPLKRPIQASASGAAKPLPPAKAEADIMQMAASYAAAFNRGDAKAVASHFCEDAESIDETGRIVQGRDAIEAQTAAMFEQSPGAKISINVKSIRLLTDDVAIEHGMAIVTPVDGPPSTGLYTAVHKRDGRGWKIASVRESVQPAPSSHYEQLQPLAWMVGVWRDEADAGVVTTTCEWTRNKNFLTRNFTLNVADRVAMQGVQVIGYDAADGVIRSWVFDSEGGFSQGEWTADGNRWIIKNQGVTPDGKRATMVNVLTKIDNDTCSWGTLAREEGGEILPNIKPITIRRVKAE
jgi:uncharacterized protein (TIGR02246 family)